MKRKKHASEIVKKSIAEMAKKSASMEANKACACINYLWVRSLNASNVNCTYKSYAIVKTGEWFIWNTVKENGYSSSKSVKK